VETVATLAGMKAWSAAREAEGVALVPTMGALHDGHLALVRAAVGRFPQTVVSIFVNPAQFGPNEDFARYPRDLDRDRQLLAEAGCRALFAPSAAEMYPDGFQTWTEVTELERHLCGPHRPGHFRGVATVVLKLFTIVRPRLAVFGEKDYQQLQVIRRMAADLDLGIDVVGHPTVREPDGLAMSSRNAYLSNEERTRALGLIGALRAGAGVVAGGERRAGPVREAMLGVLAAAGVDRIDYAAVADPDTLADVDTVGRRVLLALAVRVGKTRLIDNLVAESA
jgi:pantoate--beta-alanine ligase